MREQTILKTSVTRHVILDKNLSTGVSVTSQKSARLSTCVRGISFAPFYNLSIGFWNCSDIVVFFFSVLLTYSSAVVSVPVNHS